MPRDAKETRQNLADADDAAQAAEKIRRERAVRLTAFLQTWYGNGLGETLGGNPPGQASSQGRNYGVGGRDEFRIRRAQVALSGNPVSAFDYRVMLDFAPAHPLQDAWIGYQAGRHVRIEAGRQKTGLSEEGSRPDDQLLTIARSSMNEDLPVTAGRVGDVRSTGLAVRYAFAPIHGFVGVWNSLGDTSDLSFAGSRKFADGALYLDAIPHLTLGVWGGTNIGGSGPVEHRSRVGGTLLYRSGRTFFEAEAVYGRDYAAGAPAPGKTGSLERGGYLMLAYRVSPRWQVVARYDNWDPAQQRKFTGVAITESGVAIPPANHKLREYTLGVNYDFPKRDARLQLNLIREDVEQNGGSFFGVPRNLVFLNFQIGYDTLAASRSLPEDYGLQQTPNRKTFALQNAIRIGFITAPAPGLALGMDVGFPRVRLLPGAFTRISGDLLAPFDVPSFLGFPQTFATFSLDQVFQRGRPGGRGFYGGFGIGGNIGTVSRSGGKLFVGDNLSAALGLELCVDYIGLPAPRITLQTRIPL